MTHHNIEVERDSLGQEFRVWEVKVDVEYLPADAHVRVLHVGRAGVDPVELVGVRDGLKLFQLEPEFPGVGHEVEEIGRAFGRPIIQEILILLNLKV